MGEIANSDVKDVKPQNAENYQKMKPEKEMTMNERNEATKEEFDKASESKEYFDDNGNKYREGDNLMPDNKFEVNGYTYKTDDQGRVISAKGQLRLEDHEKLRNTGDMDSRSVVGKGEMLKTDDRGHLIAYIFGGSDGMENLSQMDAHLNKSDYKKMENTLADAVKDGADVRLKVEPVYEGDSIRPSEFRATYMIDGEKTVVVFKNESEAKS